MTTTKYRLYTARTPIYTSPDYVHFSSGCFRDRLFLLNTGELVYANYVASTKLVGEGILELGVGVEHDNLTLDKQFDNLNNLFSHTSKEQLIARQHVLLERRDAPIEEGSDTFYYDYIDVARLFWDDEGVHMWT